MDKPAELLIRSALHDVANVLAGVRGILDLSSTDEPLTTRDRDRLEAVIDEGLATLERTRNLAMATLPDPAEESGEDWRGGLLEALQPMGVIFRTRIELLAEGEPALDRWPGEPLRSYVRAVTRQVLPYVRTGHLTLRLVARERDWVVRWEGVEAIPDNLLPPKPDAKRDIASRWAEYLTGALAIDLSLADGALLARIPRT